MSGHLLASMKVKKNEMFLQLVSPLINKRIATNKTEME